MSCRHLSRILMMGLWLGLGACGQDEPSGPDPTPTPVYGIPHAKVFDNLPLIRSLERKIRADSVLTGMGTNAKLDGTPQDGSYWYYVFTDFSQSISYTWAVRVADGEVLVPGEGLQLTRLPDIRDLEGLVTLDSDKAIQIALRAGAQAYVERYPAKPNVVLGYKMQAGLPVCQMFFEDQSGAAGFCQVEFWVNASTSELLARDVSCLGQ